MEQEKLSNILKAIYETGNNGYMFSWDKFMDCVEVYNALKPTPKTLPSFNPDDWKLKKDTVTPYTPYNPYPFRYEGPTCGKNTCYDAASTNFA